MKTLQVTEIENIDALVVSTLTEIEQLEAQKKTLGKHIGALKKRVRALCALSERGESRVTLHVESHIEHTAYQELYEEGGETQVLDTLWKEPRMLPAFEYAGGIEPLPVAMRDFPSRQTSMFEDQASGDGDLVTDIEVEDVGPAKVEGMERLQIEAGSAKYGDETTNS